MRTQTICGVVALALVLSAVAGAAEKPNFIVIMADDMSAHELACYGNEVNRTPRLDRLAETGVKFATCFATPICHPTRFEIMTGQYGAQNGIYNFPDMRGGPNPHGPFEDMDTHITFAEMLKPLGYATALAGKWQLPGSPPDLIFEEQFDEYLAWGYDNYYSAEESQKVDAWKATGVNPRPRYWKPQIIHNGRFVETDWDAYGPDMFVEFINDFVRRKKDEPFFVYYPMCLPHTPNRPTPDTVQNDEEKKEQGAQYWQSNVEYVDTLIGRIVDNLEETGLRGKTVIFITSDNGSPGGRGKGEPNELGARVPMIINAPGLVKERGETMELTDLSDVFPTLVELAGGNLPNDRGIVGQSLAPFLTGETDAHTRDWIFSYISDRRILRTKRWLLVDESHLHEGTFYDCGESREIDNYKDVTDSEDPEVEKARRLFRGILAALPSPYVPTEGEANQRDKNRQFID